MKRQNAISGSHATAVIRDHADMMNRPDHEILPDGPLTSGLEVLERKDLLPLLAQRIAQLPLPEPSAAAQQELRPTMRHLPTRSRASLPASRVLTSCIDHKSLAQFNAIAWLQ